MISKPLFRLGDLVVVRPDLQPGVDYRMMHATKCDVAIDAMCAYCNWKIVIYSIGTNEKYSANRCCEYNWTDEMLVEGCRVMQFISRGGNDF